MKLTSALLLLSTVAPCALFAQTRPATRRTPSKTAHSPATKSSTKPADPCGPDALPALSSAIPKTEGCPKTLYGLHYLDTLVGTGPLAETHKWYTVAYTGYLADGTKFDTSIGKDPITFPYGARQVIPGWDTGFEGMHIGGKRRLFIPYQLAYGESGRPPTIPAKAELIFDLELISMSDKPPAPKTPPTPPTPTQPAGTTPSKPATDSSKPESTPAKPAAEPEKPSAEPAKPATVPAKPATEPAKPSTDPSKPATGDPTKPTATPPASTTPKP